MCLFDSQWMFSHSGIIKTHSPLFNLSLYLIWLLCGHVHPNVVLLTGRLPALHKSFMARPACDVIAARQQQTSRKQQNKARRTAEEKPAVAVQRVGTLWGFTKTEMF